MAYGFGNRTIRDGLVFYLDAANPLSYTPTNTTWKSIAKDTSIGQFIGNTAFDSEYLGRKVIRFDGSDDYIIGQMGNDRLLDFNKTGIVTVQVFFTISTLQTKKPLFCAGANNSTYAQYGVGITNIGGSDNIYAYIFDDNSDESINTNILIDLVRYPYRLLTVTFGGSRSVYFDDTFVNGHTIIPTTIFGNYWFVSTSPLTSDFFTGGVHAIRVYNRELTSEEVSQNYQFFNERN